jgi:hypothetical protein
LVPNSLNRHDDESAQCRSLHNRRRNAEANNQRVNRDHGSCCPQGRSAVSPAKHRAGRREYRKRHCGGYREVRGGEIWEKTSAWADELFCYEAGTHQGKKADSKKHGDEQWKKYRMAPSRHGAKK